MRKTKIVCTIGPATDTVEMMERLILAGMNVARLNFSHGSHADHAARVTRLREVSKRLGRPLAILQDLQGPKIRTGKLLDGKYVQLEQGAQFVITTNEVIGTAARVSTTYEALPQDVTAGDRILMSDGLLEVRVVAVEGDDVITEVLVGGELRENQGINLPGVVVSAPSMTEKDAEDLAFGMTQDIDYVALSFVRCAEDVLDIKARIAAAGKSIPVISKIEKPEAIAEMQAIVDASDAIMVARGDLGVEMLTEEVPVVQKQLIEAANAAGKPVITATQMLDSMIRNPRPTRAEASDVANAILDGTDAVMLSGETATGKYPIESVEMMARIAEMTEKNIKHVHHDMPSRYYAEKKDSIDDAISAAAYAIVQELPIMAVLALTISGMTALRVARLRPNTDIIGITPSEATYRRLSLVYGIKPVLTDHISRLDDLTDYLRRVLVDEGHLKQGDLVVMTGGHPVSASRGTNFVKVVQI